MNKNNLPDPEINVLALQRDIEDIAPLFDDISGTERLGSPADSIINAIHAQAGRSLLQRKFRRRLQRVLRVAAAAAVLALIINSGIHINRNRENNRRQAVLNQLCIVSSESGTLQEERAMPDSTTEDLAAMLMEIQGFDADSYFAVN